MAVTKIHLIKTTLNKAIDYICNPDKTDNQILISSYGCSYQTADIEFGFTLSKARDKGDNLGHHLIQSFAPGEVSYEEAHRIGKELADKVLGGKYEYVLTTHIDKGHIHNHIIFCAVNFLFAVAGLLSILASVSFTLFLSAGCKSTVSSLAVSLVFCIAPAVISMTVPGELSTWLCSILPASGTSIQASVLYAMTDFRFLNLAGLSVWTPYAMIGFCMIEIPLFAFLAVRSYCRHEWN